VNRFLLERYSENVLTHCPERITGFILACLGTMRSAFWCEDSNEWIYEEQRATVYPDRNAGAHAMVKHSGRELWKYTAMIPVVDDKRYLIGLQGVK
jgi:hypothetical protein